MIDNNTGNYNTGDWNVGDRNVGNFNVGNFNVGDFNVGYHNVGDWNVGDWNVGDWNVGDRNVGYCNTIDQPILIFNKPYNGHLDDIEWPNFYYFIITEWIKASDMTTEEKDQYPNYKTTEGYLKKYDYKEAWRNSWDKATLEDKRKVLDLPNFDNEIFKEISGIDVEKELDISTPKKQNINDCMRQLTEALDNATKLISKWEQLNEK